MRRLFRQLFTTVLAVILSASTLWLLADAPPRWDFAQIKRQALQRYGQSNPVGGRLDEWQQLIQREGNSSESEQLKAVNRFFNLQLRYREDIDIWGQLDYWATPVESLQRGAGDCEDYAIAKYFTLRQLGVPVDKLRITYVKALQLNQAHMVLTYYPHPGAMPLVLDNLIDTIEPANQRTDLRPVYAFNAEGLWMPGQGGERQVGDSKRLSRWQDLLKKMRAEGFPAH